MKLYTVKMVRQEVRIVHVLAPGPREAEYTARKSVPIPFEVQSVTEDPSYVGDYEHAR